MLGEALRYLGIRGEADEQTLRLVLDCMEILGRVAAPKCRLRRLSPAEFTPLVMGEDIRRHTDGAEEIILMAATLGIGVDTEIKKIQTVDMSRAAVLDACAAAMIEKYCDDSMPDGLPGSCRFSPGYGDYPLSMQGEILKAVGATAIGITVLESHMLLPSKSVTAVIAPGKGMEACRGKCQRCNKKDCAYRDGGT